MRVVAFLQTSNWLATRSNHYRTIREVSFHIFDRICEVQALNPSKNFSWQVVRIWWRITCGHLGAVAIAQRNNFLQLHGERRIALLPIRTIAEASIVKSSIIVDSWYTSDLSRSSFQVRRNKLYYFEKKVKRSTSLHLDLL